MADPSPFGRDAPAGRHTEIPGPSEVVPEASLAAVTRVSPREAGLHRALGLSDEEAERIVEILEREPNHLELALYAVMWSEHCSYKSSRLHLRRLPTVGPDVLVGPGENAGVMDVGDGIAVAIRIESHNHPSAVEPYQGAATGVGGILRDIFTMGARPIAIMDPLFFGGLDDARTRWLVEGVVGGISGYGNSVGVPTVGGELTFSDCYARNPLVNVLCMGVMPIERLVLGQASGEGNLAILLGSSTGRDGIGGVSVLASAGFGGEGAEDLSKRPSVQVGDPYEEKRLIEACLELLDRHLVVGIQDLGGAGLICATSETAARAGMGMDVDITSVHRREPGMEPYEVMTSESQERMLAIVTPEDRAAVEEVCHRWEVRSSVVGIVTAPVTAPDAVPMVDPGSADESGSAAASEKPVGHLRIVEGFGGRVLADIPAASLSDDAPLYGPAERPAAPPLHLAERQAQLPTPNPDVSVSDRRAEAQADLLAILCDPSWVYSQYDHQLFLNTVEPPGGDAVLLKLTAPGLPPSRRGLAVSTDSNPRWCSVDPRKGTSATVIESALNVACVGARPIAVVNCLNFGNPEHPEVMWQLSESIDGMAEACLALGLPVIGGNVSLYNESGGADIDPTPVVAVLGVVDELVRRPAGVRLVDQAEIVLLGSGSASLAGSRWAVERHHLPGGTLDVPDLEGAAALIELVRSLVGDGDLVSGIHDVSGGGLAVALAECVVRSGVGCVVDDPGGLAGLYSEASPRVLVCTHNASEVIELAAARDVPARIIGRCGGDLMVVGDLVEISVADLTAAWKGVLPAALEEAQPAVAI